MRVVYPHGIDIDALNARLAIGDLALEEAVGALRFIFAHPPITVGETDTAHDTMTRRGTTLAVVVKPNRADAKLRA